MIMQTEAAEMLDEFVVTRSPELREKLVLQSVPLVHYIMGRLGISQAMDRDYEDLAHQGLMGLIEAIDRLILMSRRSSVPTPSYAYVAGLWITCVPRTGCRAMFASDPT